MKMRLSGVNIEKICEQLTDYETPLTTDQVALCNRILFDGIEPNAENGDVIMVFGSPTCMRHRSPKGAQLFFENRAPYILLSGGREINGTGCSEAQNMWAQMRALGVPNEKIFMESESMYTHENVLFSSDLIRAVFGEKPVTVLAVSSPYHMRRVLLNFAHYRELFVNGSRWLPCPSSGSGADIGMWHIIDSGRYRVARECLALVNYVRKGYLTDMEI